MAALIGDNGKHVVNNLLNTGVNNNFKMMYLRYTYFVLYDYRRKKELCYYLFTYSNLYQIAFLCKVKRVIYCSFRLLNTLLVLF